jgi:hypothetical protein
MLRISRSTRWAEAPEGAFAHSEGNLVRITVVVVHPDDYKLLTSRDNALNKLTGELFSTGLKRSWWESWHDASISGEEGDPLAEEFFEKLYRALEERYSPPQYVEVEVEGRSDWPELPPLPLIEK